MMTLAANWRLLYQRHSAWLFFCLIMGGFFGVAFLSGGGGNSASVKPQVSLFLWVATSAGALSAIVWKEAMGKPHTFCLPKWKYETGAVSVISAMLLLFILASIWFGIRFLTEGVYALTEAGALFIYGSFAFLIGTWMAFQFSTFVVLTCFFLLPFFALSIFSDFTSSLAAAFGGFLFTSPLVSIPVGVIAAITLGVYTWNQTGRIQQRRKLCIAPDPGFAIFNITKVVEINRIRERRAADKAPQASLEVTRERREAFFLGRLKRAYPNPAQQYMWGYLYRWFGNPKVMNRSTFPYQIIGLLALGTYIAWSGHGTEIEGPIAFMPQGIMIMMFGAFAPLPLLRPMTLIAGRRERLSTVMVLFLVYSLMALGLLLVLNLSIMCASALLAQFSSQTHDFHLPAFGWTALTAPLFILPILFLARLDLVRLGRAWLWGAYLIGWGPIALLMLLSPFYQFGLGILMWAACIWRYRRHFRRAPLASPDGDNSLDLLFRG